MAASLLAAALLVAGAAASCGHTVHRPAEGVERFDFRAPGCRSRPPADPTPNDAVVVRYLGAGGLYVGWRGAAILTGPFFSNPDLVEVAVGRNRPDCESIARGLDGLPLDRIGAILFGHSHHDHLADALAVASRIPGARLYVNRTGELALAGDLPAHRLAQLEHRLGEPRQLADAAGRLLPFRVRAVRSDHAPHVGRIRFFSGEGGRPLQGFHQLPYRHFKSGLTLALVIELTADADDDAPVLYRLLYQDSASREPVAHLPALDGGYDLVVTCMASAHLAPGYPEDVVAFTGARHVLVTHYENFFRPWGPGHGFVPFLTDSRADAFLDRVGCGLEGRTAAPSPPTGEVCGPSTDDWTMPVVGAWMTFRPSAAEDERERR